MSPLQRTPRTTRYKALQPDCLTTPEVDQRLHGRTRRRTPAPPHEQGSFDTSEFSPRLFKIAMWDRNGLLPEVKYQIRTILPAQDHSSPGTFKPRVPLTLARAPLLGSARFCLDPSCRLPRVSTFKVASTQAKLGCEAGPWTHALKQPQMDLRSQVRIPGSL